MSAIVIHVNENAMALQNIVDNIYVTVIYREYGMYLTKRTAEEGGQIDLIIPSFITY